MRGETLQRRLGTRCGDGQLRNSAGKSVRQSSSELAKRMKEWQG